MIDWHKMHGKRRSDWPATLRNWMRKAAEFHTIPAKAPKARSDGRHYCIICPEDHEWECKDPFCVVSHRYQWPCAKALAAKRAVK